MKKIGLLAGVGRLPVEFARAARGMGFDVVAIGVVPGVDAELAQVANKLYTISVGELDTVIATLKAEEIKEVTMLGKVTKELIFSSVKRDARIQRMFAGLTDYSDDTLMLAFVKELAGEGVGVLDQTSLIRTLMPAPGVLTERQPSADEQADLEFGVLMARKIGGLDIGQTVVVKNRAVMAVEAIEGTDACIRRGGELGRGGVTVAKVAKPQQDLRFDMPAIGPNTIQAMIDAGAVALAMEAGKTLLVDREQVLAMANRHGITMIAM